MKYKIPHLGIRMVKERTLTIASTKASNPHDVAAIAHAMIGNRPVEHMIAIMVDGQGNVTGVTTLAQGGMSSMSIKAIDVLRAVLATHACAFILAHNHPSGDPTPSPDDIATTQAIQAACKPVGLVMLDHVIVTRDPNRFASVPL